MPRVRVSHDGLATVVPIKDGTPVHALLKQALTRLELVDDADDAFVMVLSTDPRAVLFGDDALSDVLEPDEECIIIRKSAVGAKRRKTDDDQEDSAALVAARPLLPLRPYQDAAHRRCRG